MASLPAEPAVRFVLEAVVHYCEERYPARGAGGTCPLFGAEHGPRSGSASCTVDDVWAQLCRLPLTPPPATT